MPEVIAPDYARVVLVPVANPATASDLLRLAASLAHPEEGKVFALIVSLGDPESEAKAIQHIEPICDELIEEGYNIELLTQISTSVSRGILDTAREMGADLIVVGLKKPTRGQVELGPVVESVLEASPCDVIMYRAAHSYEFKRVIVPVDDFGHVRVACKMGIWIGQRYDKSVEAIYVRRSGQSYYEASAHIEAALNDLPSQRDVRRQVVEGQNLVEAILSRVTPDDLIVVGFDERTDFERMMFGEMSVGLLNRAPGPVLLVSRSQNRTTAAQRASYRMMAWLRPVLTRVEQDDIVRLSRESASVTLDYLVLIVISALLASLGLLLNSGAVIIGAMLVAPLMQPLIAFSVGLTSGQLPIMRRSAFTLFEGIVVALIVAFGIGLIAAIDVPTSEMLVRGSPSLLDAIVAFASGVVGAYATARKDIPAALAGVAIAAALMPPLCTVGLGFALNNRALALGSGLLFITNILCIILAAIIVFFWLGMYDRAAEFGKRRQIVSFGLILLLTVIVAWELFLLNNRVTDEGVIRGILIERVEPAELVNVDVVAGNPTVVIATVRFNDENSLPNFEFIHDEIERRLERSVLLEIIPQQILSFTPSEESDGAEVDEDVKTVEEPQN